MWRERCGARRSSWLCSAHLLLQLELLLKLQLSCQLLLVASEPCWKLPPRAVRLQLLAVELRLRCGSGVLPTVELLVLQFVLLAIELLAPRW